VVNSAKIRLLGSDYQKLSARRVINTPFMSSAQNLLVVSGQPKRRILERPERGASFTPPADTGRSSQPILWMQDKAGKLIYRKKAACLYR
jgi:hypothetical protein